MKKIFFITLLLVACAASRVSAQSNHLDIRIETADKAAIGVPDNAIQITIKGDYPGYTVMLFDKEPWTGSTPIKTIKDSKENTASFNNLQPGFYHVCVLDAKENMDCKKVEVSRR